MITMYCMYEVLHDCEGMYLLGEGAGLVVRGVGNVTLSWVEADRGCSVEHQDNRHPHPAGVSNYSINY